ncbi:hypothetical protein [Porcipelethomonas sp.]|uniref:hypothetical protein n=1 Tax=Porcipelethomonas sp. TaxID=2981675 RepID=UPI003079F2CA
MMLAIGIILFAISEADDSFWLSWGGLMLVILGINFLIAPTWVLEEMKKNSGKGKKKSSSQRNNRSICSIGKDHDDFYHKNYDDMAEFLKSRGFRNVVTKPERKELFDTEGAIKGISVAGNTEFSEDDEFDVDTKILIRYYTRKH